MQSRPLAPIVGGTVGVAMIAFGVISAIGESDDTKPLELGTWLVGVNLVHDLIAVPIVLAVAWFVHRFAPTPFKAPVLWALAASVIFIVFGWPFVAGYGRNPGVPSLLNRNYGAGLAAYLVVIWMIAVIWSLVGWRLTHSNRDSTELMS